MAHPDPQLVESAALPYLLSLPPAGSSGSGLRPVLCFLHGYDEGPPTPIREGVSRHGPFRATSSAMATEEFIVVAPQLSTRGDLWYRHVDNVREIVQKVQADHLGDSEQTFLTGFSFGANGVFDLALEQPDFWAALWPVDPTRVPEKDPGLPIWLSSGEISRRGERGFIERLDLQRLGSDDPGDRVYMDQGRDHVGTAALAYQDDRIYRWLLSKRAENTDTRSES